MPNIVRALIAGFAPVSVSIRYTFGMTAALFWRVLAKRAYEQWAHSAEADVDPVLAGCLSKAALLYGGLAVNTAASYFADRKDAHKPNGSIRSISMRTTSLLLILLVWNAVTHYAMSRLPLLPVRERIRSPSHLFNPFRATIVSGSFQPLRAVDTRCPPRGLASPPLSRPLGFPARPDAVLLLHAHLTRSGHPLALGRGSVARSLASRTARREGVRSRSATSSGRFRSRCTCCSSEGLSAASPTRSRGWPSRRHSSS